MDKKTTRFKESGGKKLLMKKLNYELYLLDYQNQKRLHESFSFNFFISKLLNFSKNKASFI